MHLKMINIVVCGICLAHLELLSLEHIRLWPARYVVRSYARPHLELLLHEGLLHCPATFSALTMSAYPHSEQNAIKTTMAYQLILSVYY